MLKRNDREVTVTQGVLGVLGFFLPSHPGCLPIRHDTEHLIRFLVGAGKYTSAQREEACMKKTEIRFSRTQT